MPKELPEPLKPENYEYTKDLPLHGWAWEALRRHPDYRKAYQDFLIESETFRKKHGKNWDQVILKHIPEKQENETLHGWRARVFMNGRIPRELNLSGQYARKFHLFQMHDPAQKYSPEIAFITKMPLFFIEQYEQLQDIPTEVEAADENAPLLIAPDVAVVVFNLNRNLKQQIDLAKKLATEKAKRFEIKQKTTLKKKQAQWRQHIMVLDAIESGVKFSGAELVHFFGTHSIYGNTSKSGGDFKKEARKFPAKYKELLKGYYSE